MAPRPILKTQIPDAYQPLTSPLPFSACSHSQLLYQSSPHVHFPPTPTLTRTVTTHSSSAYDRAPIVVLPNECALPERGGRVYDVSDFDCDTGEEDVRTVRKRSTNRLARQQQPTKHIESYFHPRAFEACEAGTFSVDTANHGRTPTPPSMPLLVVPDMTFSSSSSDESDDLASPPLGQVLSPMQQISSSSDASHIHTVGDAGQGSNSAIALSFLPHPPSPGTPKKSPRKQRSPNRAKTNGDCLSYNRWAISNSNSAFSDPGMDGCLGGF